MTLGRPWFLFRAQFSPSKNWKGGHIKNESSLKLDPWAQGCSSVVRCLPGMYEAPSLIPSGAGNTQTRPSSVLKPLQAAEPWLARIWWLQGGETL